MKKKAVISSLLCMALLLSGGIGTINVNADETEKLTIWVKDDIRIQDWNTNGMTAWLEEQTGYDLELVAMASDGYLDKVNMSLTTGGIDELPDMIMFAGGAFPSDSQVLSWAEAESIVPLTDYYANADLAVNLNEAKERTGVDFTSHLVLPDGNVYGLPVFNQSYGNEYPQKIWIYEPWLEALGKEVPKTTEEFFDLLTEVAATDLNGNGKKDEIGLLGAGDHDMSSGGYVNILMNAFVYAGDANYLAVNDGTVNAAYTTEAWKEGLKYIRTFFENGSIPKEIFSISPEQLKTMLNTEECTVFAFTDYEPMSIDQSTGRHAEYICIESLTGPEGVNYSTYVPTVALTGGVITANCKNPEAAFKVADLMCSKKMSISTRWGEEGVNWDYPENVADIANYKAGVDGWDISLVAYNDGAYWGGTDPLSYGWRQVGPYVREYGIANGSGVDVTREDIYITNTNNGKDLYQKSSHRPEEVIPKLIYTSEEAEVVASIESVLNNYVVENIAFFVTGIKDIDADWDSYIAELEKIGLSKYIEVVQGAYNRMYK